jgi:universal stress protein A
MAFISKILVATDFSEAATQVAQEALSIGAKLAAELLLVHVIDPTPYVLTADVGYSSAAIFENQERAAKAALSKLEAELHQAGARVSSLLLYGPPHERLIDAARSEQVHLIAMGTHGRGGLRHALLGSVAERVARTSPVPVLTVRAAS